LPIVLAHLSFIKPCTIWHYTVWADKQKELKFYCVLSYIFWPVISHWMSLCSASSEIF
jgi:hypothetical protein